MIVKVSIVVKAPLLTEWRGRVGRERQSLVHVLLSFWKLSEGEQSSVLSDTNYWSHYYQGKTRVGKRVREFDWLISSFIFGFIFWSPPSRTMDLSNAFLVLPLDKKSHRGWPCQLSSSGLDWLEAVKPSHLTEWPSRNSFWVCRRTHFKVPLTFIHFSFDFRISQDVYAEKPLFYSWTREQWIHMKWIRLFHTGLFVPRLPSFCRIQLNEPW